MTTIQYTIRNIPPSVDKELRRRARVSKKSFNQVVVDQISKDIGIEVGGKSGRFDWLAGTMDENEAKVFDEAISALNKPDPEFWK